MAELFFTSDGRRYLLVIVAIAIIGLLALPWTKPIFESVLNELPFPLSKHAMDGHTDEKWNAITIQEHMKLRKCTPNEYICADKDQEIVWCEAEKGVPAIGLIIGRTFRQVITAFAGRNNYWQNRCQ